MLVIAAVFFFAIVKLEAVEISCEEIDLSPTFGTCCYLNEVTVISAENVTFATAENLEVDTILLKKNKRIKFLPVEVSKKFPNLEAIHAGFASIRKISGVNFAGLSSLKWLDLSFNLIEFIPDDCFEGLKKLQNINLGTLEFF